MTPTPRALVLALVLAVFADASVVAAQPAPDPPLRPRPIVVGSKPFGESYLLAEMFAQLLEARGHRVVRRMGLGGTDIIFPALQQGAVDVYPEYTGAGLLVILKERLEPDASRVFDLVSREFRARFDARWLAPLGFENTYAMSVRTELADRLGLRTLSDFARVSPELRAGFTADFIGRQDGLPGLTAAYGLAPLSVSALSPAVKYQALMSGAVDVIDAYSTDGLLARFPITVLQDDRHFFPPYDAAALVRGELARAQPSAIAALTELSGRIDVMRMRGWNARVEVNGEETVRVAGDALAELGLVGEAPTGPATSRTAAATSLWTYLWDRRVALGRLAARHLLLAGVSLLLAVAAAVPAGLAVSRSAAAPGVVRAVGILQTIPGLALLAFLLPLLGIGVAPALVALFLYALYPIVQNTVVGVQAADAGAAAAAEAVGMTPRQVLWYVRVPLAAPVIMAGIRTAAVLNVGTATLAALVGAGGLGDPIVAGLALSDARMILSGAIPAAVLAVAVDWCLGLVQRRVTPRALRSRRLP